MTLFELLETKKYIIFDGAFGTMLQKYGLKPGENPAVMNITAPEAVEKIHRMYAEAGSDIICANTFCANAISLRKTEYETKQIIAEAIKIAHKAISAYSTGTTRPLVALDIGSTGQILEPAGDLSFKEAYNIFKEIAIAGERAGADLAAIETMSDIGELRAAISAITDNTKLPVFATMTFEASGFTFMGCTTEEFAKTAEALGAAAIGLNCSLEPRRMFDIAKKITATSKLPLIIKPNAGLPDATTGLYDTGPEEFAAQMSDFKQLGVRVVGGCCGTTPEYIKALKKEFVNEQ